MGAGVGMTWGQLANIAKATGNKALAATAAQGAVAAQQQAVAQATAKAAGAGGGGASASVLGVGSSEAAGSVVPLGEAGLAVNPVTAIGGLAAIGSQIAAAAQGKPKMQDTAQAALRLIQSGIPALIDLGKYFETLVYNGVPLSTSSPKLQREIERAKAGTVSTLLASYPTLGTAPSVSTALNRALTSEFGPSATTNLVQTIHRVAGEPAVGVITPVQPHPITAPPIQPPAPLVTQTEVPTPTLSVPRQPSMVARVTGPILDLTGVSPANIEQGNMSSD